MTALLTLSLRPDLPRLSNVPSTCLKQAVEDAFFLLAAETRYKGMAPKFLLHPAEVGAPSHTLEYARGKEHMQTRVNLAGAALVCRYAGPGAVLTESSDHPLMADWIQMVSDFPEEHWHVFHPTIQHEVLSKLLGGEGDLRTSLARASDGKEWGWSLVGKLAALKDLANGRVVEAVERFSPPTNWVTKSKRLKEDLDRQLTKRGDKRKPTLTDLGWLADCMSNAGI